MGILFLWLSLLLRRSVNDSGQIKVCCNILTTGKYISLNVWRLSSSFHGHFFFNEGYLSQKLWQWVCVHTQQRLLILLCSLTFVTDIWQWHFATELSLHEYIFLRQTYFVKKKCPRKNRLNMYLHGNCVLGRWLIKTKKVKQKHLDFYFVILI